MEELEEMITLPELESIVQAIREKEWRHFKFLASLKGIDLEAEQGSAPKDKVADMKRKIQANKKGVSVESLDLNDMGIDVETE